MKEHISNADQAIKTGLAKYKEKANGGKEMMNGLLGDNVGD
jgi:hypothetical protein